MTELIKARLIRYLTYPVTYIAAAASLFSGIVQFGGCADRAEDNVNVIPCPVDDMWITIAMWALIVLTALCSGTEFSSNAIRNKIIAGHSKKNVFLSEILSSSVITLGIFILNIVPTIIGSLFFLKLLPLSVTVMWVIVLFLSFEIMTVLTVTLSYLSSAKEPAIAVVAAFALQIVLYIIIMSTSDYYYNTEPEYITEINEFSGEAVTLENLDYIDGAGLILVKAEHAVNPVYGLVDPIHMIYIKDRTIADESDILFADERERDIYFNMVKMPLLCVIVTFGGMTIFSKKNIR